ncbi:MAG: Flp pilus assembly complex ATPase component TadA, partial [Proteobacteria bacterium]|nr:Flp pilus assembly complex ATPase component TadA [Pseudomonadota bacterium]
EFLSGPSVEMDPTMQPVVTALDNMLTHAFDQRASDIHIEPQENNLRIRFRVDGIMREAMTLPFSIHGSMTSRLKILAGLNIAERRRPQDGQFFKVIAGQGAAQFHQRPGQPVGKFPVKALTDKTRASARNIDQLAN